jgi:hypothetical protein
MSANEDASRFSELSSRLKSITAGLYRCLSKRERERLVHCMAMADLLGPLLKSNVLPEKIDRQLYGYELFVQSKRGRGKPRKPTFLLAPLDESLGRQRRSGKPRRFDEAEERSLIRFVDEARSRGWRQKEALEVLASIVLKGNGDSPKPRRDKVHKEAISLKSALNRARKRMAPGTKYYEK